MGDTAKLFNCRVSFVSSVENGKKKVPDSWAPKIIEHYHLDEGQQDELYEDNTLKSWVKLDGSPVSNASEGHYKIKKREEM